MADTDQQQRLLLQIDASIELLRRSLASGEQPIDRFEQRAVKMGQNVDASIARMGQSFPNFARMAEDSATKAQRSFEESFSSIERTAAAALTGVSKKGNINLGAAEMKATAEAARAQASAIGLVAAAAERAAAGEGVLTNETRLYLTAARAAKLAADQHADELIREAGALERLEIEMKAAGAGAQLLALRQRSGNTQSAAQRAGFQQLSFQVGDIANQYAAGTAMMIIFAQQSGQVVQALGLMAGESKGLLSIIGGPWGQLFTAALVVLTPFVAKLFEGADGAKKAKDAEEDYARFQTTLANFIDIGNGKLRERLRLLAEIAVRENAQKQKDASTRATDLNRQAFAEAEAGAPVIRREFVSERQPFREIYDPQFVKAIGDAKGDAGQLARNLQALAKTKPELQAVADRVSKLAGEMLLARQESDKYKGAQAELNFLLAGGTVLSSELVERQVAEATAVTALEKAQAKLNAVKARGAEIDRMDPGRERQLALRQYRQDLLAATREVNRLTAAQKEAKDTSNREFGRSVSSNEAAQIARDKGWQVNSADRSYANQKRLYDAWVANGRPADNPVAKPGTSAHERGNAIDIQIEPGVTVAAIRKAFEAEGVRLTKVFKERGHYHVEWGASGKSQDQLDKEAERARQTVLSDQISYTEEERRARRRLIDATRRSADTEEQRDALMREDINAEADAEKTRVDLEEKKGQLTKAQADHLRELNETTRKTRLQNVAIDRATAVIVQQRELELETLRDKIAMLRIQQDLAGTNAERRRIAFQILELEQEERRKALEKVRDTSNDPNAVQSAKDALGRLPKVEDAEREQARVANEGPMARYRDDLIRSVGDMNEALENVKVHGLQSLEDGFTDIITGTKSVGDAFKDMANAIIADLVRIAIRKLILDQVFGGMGGGGSFLGLSMGGEIEGKAGGGRIVGPGSGISDSILALIGGRKPLRVSNGEFIVNAASTSKYLPLIEAINSDALPAFATGGAIPSASALRYPRPNYRAMREASRGRNDRMEVAVRAKVEASPLLLAQVEETSVRTVGAAAEPIMAGAENRTLRRMSRPELPGGWG